MIILLNGSINAGKTTVSKQLRRMLPRTAHVEVDGLRVRYEGADVIAISQLRAGLEVDNGRLHVEQLRLRAVESETDAQLAVAHVEPGLLSQQALDRRALRKWKIRLT